MLVMESIHHDDTMATALPITAQSSEYAIELCEHLRASIFQLF